jgi:hypothetical protein
VRNIFFEKSHIKKCGIFPFFYPGGNDLDMTGYTAIVEALSLEGNVALGALSYTMGSWTTKVKKISIQFWISVF